MLTENVLLKEIPRACYLRPFCFPEVSLAGTFENFSRCFAGGFFGGAGFCCCFSLFWGVFFVLFFLFCFLFLCHVESRLSPV